MPVSRQRGVHAAPKPWYLYLYFWVLVGIVGGLTVGFIWPSVGVSLEPLGSAFVSLIKMIITPVIFLTVVAGIGGVDDLRRVGRIGIKSLIYFEGVTTIALILGLVVINVFKPGVGVHADPNKIEIGGTAAHLIQQGENTSWWHYLTDMVPASVVGAFAQSNVLQVLFFAVLFGISVKAVGPVGIPITIGVNRLIAVIFKLLHLLLWAAPVGAFGAMAFAVGKYGTATLTSLGSLIGLFYGTSLFFIVVVLGTIAALIRINIFQLLRYLSDELLVVLGTSSSETVLPKLMTKLENLGVPRQVAGLTVPTGYSFNLDGTCIYLTLAAVYLAQATDTPMSIAQQLELLAVLLLTSKGAAGVTGSGFIVLAATLSTLGTIPAAAIMLIFGVDKFMSECRALTNVCGNTVASLVVAQWEGVLDRRRAQQVLSGEAVPIIDPEFHVGQQPALDSVPTVSAYRIHTR
jgi:aerobic C4-dicarboxylate transport protein